MSLKWYINKYGLSASEIKKATPAQLSEVEFWAYSNGAAVNSPLGQGYLRDLIKRGWSPWGSSPQDENNQPIEELHSIRISKGLV